MKYLVTGSSGQIGSNLILKLQSEGHEVIGIDARPNTWSVNVQTVLTDLSAAACLPNLLTEQGDLFSDVDCVVHLAAYAKVAALVEQPGFALQNIQMTFNVLELCRMYNLPIVFGSTREVYGDIKRYVTEESNANFAFTESPYAASKISSEAFIYSYAACYDIPYIVLRFSNVYGRFDNDLERMERVMPLFIRRISKNLPITIFGEKKVLDFTYVDDCVAGVHSAIKKLVSGIVKNETFNLAFGKGHSLIEVAHLIGDAVGVKPRISLDSSRKGEVCHYVADISKAREMLGYNPSSPIRIGIPKAVEWSLNRWKVAAIPISVRINGTGQASAG